MIEEKSEKLERLWIVHYSELYDSESTVDHVYIDNLHNNTTKHSLDQPSDADEVISIIKNIQSESAACKDEISGELLKASVDLLTESVLHLIQYLLVYQNCA